MESEVSTALSALKLDPEAASRLAAEGNWNELAKLYETALRTSKRGPSEVPLLSALGLVYWRRLQQLDAAEAQFRKLRKLEPTHATALDFYREYHLSRNEVPQLLALLAQVQKTEADPEARVRLGIEMAELAEQRPQSLEKAIDLWKSVLKLRPGQPKAVAALRNLYTKGEKWNALLELLKEELERIPDGPETADQKVALYLEMVPIYRDRMRLDVMVANTYTAILALRPGHLDTLAALATWQESKQRWSDLVGTLTRWAEAAREPQEKAQLYRRIAKVWAEKLGKPQNAAAALEKVLEANPADVHAEAALVRAYFKQRAWRPLLELGQRQLPVLAPEQRVKRLGELAQLASEKLGNVRLAISLWNQALEVDEGNVAALDGLLPLYEREQRWPAVAEVLRRQAEAAAATAAAPLWERRAGLLADRMDSPEAAIADYRKVLTLSPDQARVIRALRDLYAARSDFDALEELYASREQWTELFETLTGLAEKSADVPTRLRLLGRAAHVAVGPLNQPELAIRAQERMLALEPSRRESADALLGLYRQTERWSRWVALVETVLDGPIGTGLSASERLDLAVSAREIAETRLSSKSAALKWALRSWDLAPGDATRFADVERLASAADEWGTLADAYQRRLAGDVAADERVELLRRALRVARHRLDRDATRRAAEELLRATPEPGDPEALATLEEIFTAEQRWMDLVALLRRREIAVHGDADHAARIELLLRIARLEEEKLGDPGAAAETVGRALALEPGNRKLLSLLARLQEASGDHTLLVATLRRQIALEEGDERVALLLRLARLEDSVRDDPRAARAAYFDVLEIDSISAEAVAGLEDLLARGRVPADEASAVLVRLLPYYELAEKYADWARALETLVQQASTPAERRTRLDALQNLYTGPLPNRSGAYRATLRIFEMEPQNRTNRERLIEHARGAGSVPDLVAAFRRAAQTPDVTLRRELLFHIAELEEQQASRRGEAEKAWRELFELDPLSVGAFRALTRILKDAERWADLRSLIERRAEHVLETRERIGLITQVAEIDESLLGDLDHAIATHEALLALDPNLRSSYQALERLLTARGHWEDLVALLDREVSLVDETEALELQVRRAEVMLDRLHHAADALAVVEAVLDRLPRHEGAHRLLLRLLEVPETRQRTAALLEPLYVSSADWARLLPVLEIQEASLAGAEAVALRERIAELQEHRLEARTPAMASWRRVLSLDPENRRAREEFERLALGLAHHKELADVYEELAAKSEPADIATRADLLSRAAQLYRGPLNNREAAVRAYREIIDLDPANAPTARPAADALEQLYRESGDHEGLIDVLRTVARWADDREERVDLLLQIADIEERLQKNPTAAATTLQAVLDLVPDNEAALDRLERLHEATGAHNRRVEILERRLELAKSPAERKARRWQIAEMQEEQLGDLDAAIETTIAIADEDPEDRQAFDALERLYTRKGDDVRRLEVLERRLALSLDDLDRVACLRRLAELLGGRLGRPRDALDRLREALTLAPQDAGLIASVERALDSDDPELVSSAAEILAPYYERAGSWDRLVRVVEIGIGDIADRRTRMEQRVRLASLRQQKLNDAPGAFAAWATAIRDGLGEPELQGLLDVYESLGTQLGRSDEVLALYREIEPDLLNEKVRLRVQRAIAGEAMRGRDLVAAAETYQRILDQSPDDPEALTALESIYRQQDDTAALYDVVARRGELASGQPAQELPLRMELGRLSVRLERSDEAIAAFERAVVLGSSLPGTAAEDAAAELERLYESSERWADLADLLARRLERGVDAGTAISLNARLARLQAEQLGNRERALGHLAFVLQQVPDHAESVALLESFLGEPETLAAAADLLEPVYVRQSAWLKLVGLDEARRSQVDAPEQRLAWTRRIARIYEEQVEDLEKAFEWYGKVFEEAPTAGEAQDELLRLAPKLNRWGDVARWFADYLDSELSDSPEVLDVVRTTAVIYDEQVNDRDAARKFYRRYLEAQPDAAAPAALFEAALERWGEWAELRDLTEEQASRAVDQSARTRLLRRSARISEEHLDQTEQAVSTLQSLWEEVPTDREVAAELERLLASSERWSDLADHLALMASREDDARAQNAVLFRLAVLNEEKLENLEAAVDRYGEILARDPQHARARQALERFLANPDLRLRAARLLEPIQRARGASQDLVAVLEILAEGADSVGDRIVVLQEIASTEQRLGRLDRVVEAKGRAWLADPADPNALAELEGAAQAARMFPRLVDILKEGAEAAGDGDLRAVIWARAAAFIEHALGDVPGTLEAWRAALGARSDFEDAFAALERLLQQTGDWRELAAVLEKHLEASLDPDQRKTLARRAAELYEGPLADRDRAITAWRIVLEQDEADPGALDALTRLLAAAEDWSALAEVQLRRIEGANEPGARRPLRFALARLYDERLDDRGEAIGQLRALLDETTDDSEALAALSGLFRREERWDDLLETLDRRAALAREPGAREALAVEAAELVAGPLGDGRGAVERYREILARDPENAPSRQALWALARGEDLRAEAVAALEPVLRDTEAWDELVELLELKAAGEDSAGARVGVLADIAGIEEVRRGDGQRAFEAWRRAFAEDPGDEEVRSALERLAASLRLPGRLAETYEAQVAATFDVDVARRLLLRLADLYENALQEPEKALASLRKALEQGGDDDEAVLASIAALLRKLGRHAELAEAVARQAEVAPTGAAQAEHLVELGRLRLEKLNDPAGALDAWRGALDREPTLEAALASVRRLTENAELRADVLDVLEPLAEQRGDAAELVGLYELRAGMEREPERRAEWRRRIGDLQETALHDRGKALAAYGAALEDDPGSEEAAGQLLRLATEPRFVDEAGRRFEAALDRAEGQTRVDLALRAAALYEEAAAGGGDQAQFFARAERLYERALQEDEENLAALEALERLIRRNGDVPRLAALLERRAAASFDPKERAERLAEAARLHETGGEIERAIAAWEAVRQAEEGNTEALTALGRLYDKGGRSSDLLSVLEEEARSVYEPERRAALYVRVGRIKSDVVGDKEGAAAAYREALDASPTDTTAVEALAALQLELGDWAGYEDVLLQRFSVAGPDEQGQLLFRLAKNASEKLEDTDRAAGYLRQVLDIDALNGQAFASLDELLAGQERWHDLIELAEQRAAGLERAGRSDEARAARLRVADVWANKLDAPDDAREIVADVLAKSPSDLGAMLVLADLEERGERHDEALAILERAAAASPRGPQTAGLEVRRGRILAARGAPAAEVEARYRAALQLDPQQRDALSALETLLRAPEAQDRAADLVDVLLAREALARTPEERKALVKEIATLQSTTLRRPADAAKTYERLVALAPDDLEAGEAYASALLAAGQAAQAEAALAPLLPKLTAARQMKTVARLQVLLGRAAEARNDWAAATERYTAAYQIEPTQPATLAALARLAERQQDAEKAKRYYRTLLLQSFDEGATGISKPDVYVALGRLHLAGGETAKARNLFERGLEMAPSRADIKKMIEELPRA